MSDMSYDDQPKPVGLRLPGRRQTLLLTALAVIGAGAALNWSWLAATGAAPLILSLASCAAMCALGGACAGARTPAPSPRTRRPSRTPRSTEPQPKGHDMTITTKLASATALALLLAAPVVYARDATPETGDGQSEGGHMQGGAMAGMEGMEGMMPMMMKMAQMGPMMEACTEMMEAMNAQMDAPETGNDNG